MRAFSGACLALGALGAGLGLAGCGTGPAAAPSPSSSTAGVTGTPATAAGAQAQSVSQASVPAPAVTKTVTKVATVSPALASTASASTVPASTVPASTGAPPPSQAAAPAAPAAPAQPPGGPNVTDPWAVVSAYYGDIDSGDYAQAYALIGNGATTGQSYQQFAAGFACTGSQQVSENWESGSSVNFDLTAGDSCNGTTQYYTGTDTVENGTIVAADITQTG
jgi:hypothetical protein